MTKRMLIDATQAEETRVAIVSGNRLEEYDYESAIRKQLKGSIFLAKVTRVEPSLQAAFVDYGGNRHGFLPFSEIHPDYYRIPIADREELLAEAAEEISEEVEEDIVEDDEDETAEDENGEDHDDDHGDDSEETAEDEESSDESDGEEADEGNKDRQRGRRGGRRRGRRKNVDEVGGNDEDEDETPRAPRLKHQYKIQEVIKRRQIMLIQVNKEERGNKGAAVTSYISLPGRYCVLMPNSPRGGGVSRKISNSKDRQRMKEILAELNIPKGMSVIMRTAGVQRSKAEIKRDLDYLMRLWDTIRDETLQATAPALINEESNLCKRAIRDLYSRDIDEVIVAGDEGYKTAKSFMKMLMPSHSKRVQPYKDENIPLFMRYQVESQIDEMHKPTAQLRSGGYIVINPTEALVSIDVNSGRSTKERHIEGTALKTNLEAAEEVARQLRLRDLGGLVVIDFIDMEVSKNNAAVERKLKEAMSTDRARVQIGRISPFGLMELSRQRLNPSLVEAHFEVCPHCDGIGVIRTVESASLTVLRAIEEEGIRGRSSEVKVAVSTEVALYLLNQKRRALQDIEQRHGLEVFIHASEAICVSDFEIEIVKGKTPGSAPTIVTNNDEAEDKPAARTESRQDNRQDSRTDSRTDSRPESDSDDEERPGRRRRRRGGRNRNRNRDRDENGENRADDETQEAAAETRTDVRSDEHGDDDNGDDGKKRRRRRGRRGGRRRRGGQGERSAEMSETGSAETTAETASDTTAEATAAPTGETTADAGDKPKKSRSRAKKVADTDEIKADTEEKPKKPRASRAKKVADKAEVKADAEDKPKKPRASRAKKVADKDEVKADAEDKPKKPRASRAKKVADKDEVKADTEDKPKKPRASRAKKVADKDEVKADAEDKPKKPRASRAKKAKETAEEKPAAGVVDFPEKSEKAAAQDAEDNKEPEKKRKGWWNRLVD